MSTEKKVNETIVIDAKVLVKSSFPTAEIIAENGNERMIIEGDKNWFRLVRRAKGKKNEVLLIDGDTSFKKFKTDSESFLANK
ncbi:hypothetical protein [Flavicella sp.]|uniref:hypothetical protein n=1 Tax=Flavicella sp. TaxID=2957742 RepID=UPI0030160A2D